MEINFIKILNKYLVTNNEFRLSDFRKYIAEESGRSPAIWDVMWWLNRQPNLTIVRRHVYALTPTVNKTV